jgi:hypothetical protein
MNWISTTQELPPIRSPQKCSNRVLVYQQIQEGRQTYCSPAIGCFRRDEDGDYWTGETAMDILSSVTHWMPIPAPPGL